MPELQEISIEITDRELNNISVKKLVRLYGPEYFYYAICLHLVGFGGPISKEDIAASLNVGQKTVETVDAIITKLINAEIIAENDDGLYSICETGFGYWKTTDLIEA